MRTTLTLEPDVALLLKKEMDARDITFKEAVNTAIRRGLDSRRGPRRFRQKTYNLGVPLVDVTKALQLAAQMEDEVILEKLRQGR